MDLYDIETGAVFWTLVVIFGVIGVVVTAFFLLNLRDLLNQVSSQNRAMQPNHVWLNFIPVFSLVWTIVTVIKVRDSVRAEFQTRGWAAVGDYGFGVGLAYAIMSIFAGGILWIPWIVCFIIYWMRTAELKKQLRVSQPAAGWATLPAPPPAPFSGASPAGEGETPGQVDTSGPSTYATPGAVAEPTAEPPMICPVCGAENRQNAKFCRSCGRSF